VLVRNEAKLLQCEQQESWVGRHLPELTVVILGGGFGFRPFSFQRDLAVVNGLQPQLLIR
jgi:hypothetical protein